MENEIISFDGEKAFDLPMSVEIESDDSSIEPDYIEVDASIDNESALKFLDDKLAESDVVIEEPESVIIEEDIVTEIKSVETSLLSRVETAYTTLQKNLAENQKKIQENRIHIAELRIRMRELAADNRADTHDMEDELHNSKLLVQHDSCSTLMSQVEQIREHIYNNNRHARSLLSPLRNTVELLDLRVQHIGALEDLLENVKTGMKLQDHLLEIDLAIESLASKFNLI
jgi:hypothetical protein